jgi:hypothetical protein
MRIIKNIYRKIINTEPVVFLDLFKAIAVFGAATGLFVIKDDTVQAVVTSGGIVLTIFLSWLNRSNSTSNQTVMQMQIANQAKVDSVREQGYIPPPVIGTLTPPGERKDPII